MADNILRAVISVTAPGVQQTFAQVAQGAGQAQDALTGILPSASSLESALNTLAQQGGVSIGALESSLEDFKSQLQIATDPSDIAKLNLAIQSLKDKIAQLKAIATQSGIAEFGAATKRVTGDLDPLEQRVRRATSATHEFALLTGELPGLLSGVGGGARSMGNELFVLSTGIQRARETGQGFGSIIGELVGSLFSVQGATLLLVAALPELIKLIEGIDTGFSDSEVAAAAFAQSMDKIGESAKKLKSLLDLKDDLSKLRGELSGLSGQDLNIFDISNRTKSATEIIAFEENVTRGLEKQKQQISEVAKQYIELGVASSKFQELATAAVQGIKLPETFISQLPKNEQFIANDYIRVLKEIDESTKRSSDAQTSIGKDFLQSQIDQQTKEKELRDKELKDNEKFVNDTIAQGKKISSFFQGVRIVPEFTVFDTKGEEFAKAQKVISDFANGLLIPIFHPQLKMEPEFAFQEGFEAQAKKDLKDQLLPAIKSFAQSLQADIDSFGKINLKLNVEAKLTPQALQNQDEVKQIVAQQDAIAKAFGINIKKESPLTDLQEQAIFAAKTIDGVLTPAFQGLFDAIIKGQDPLKAFFSSLGQAIEQLISKLIAAAVEALVLSAIFGNVGGAQGFGQIFSKLLGFSEGGRPEEGIPALVGEKGPEIWKPDKGKPSLIGKGLFTPNEPGTIIPAHKVKEFISESNNESINKIEGNESVEKVISNSADHKSSNLSTISKLVNNQQSLSKSMSLGKEKSAFEKIVNNSDSGESNKVDKLITPKSGGLSKDDKSESSKIKADNSNFDKSVIDNSNIERFLSDKSVNAKSTYTEKLGSIINNSDSSVLEHLASVNPFPNSELKDKLGSITSEKSYHSDKSFNAKSALSNHSIFKELRSFVINNSSSLKEFMKSFGSRESFSNINNSDKQLFSDTVKSFISASAVQNSEKFIDKLSTQNNSHNDISTSFEYIIQKLSHNDSWKGSSLNNLSTYRFTNSDKSDHSAFEKLSSSFDRDSKSSTKIIRFASILNSLMKSISFRAAGGSVERGKPFIIGEKGPEFFVPKEPGTVISNHRISSYNRDREREISSSFSRVSNSTHLNSSKSSSLKSFSNISDRRSMSSIISSSSFGGFRADGGSVQGGKIFLVGEKGAELFIPNTGAGIVNNNNSTTTSSVKGGTLKVEGNIRIAGSDLIAVMSNASRSQSRLS